MVRALYDSAKVFTTGATYVQMGVYCKHSGADSVRVDPLTPLH